MHQVTDSTPGHGEAGRYIAVALLLTAATATMYLAPIAISVISHRYGLSVGGAGTLATIEMVCSGVTAFGLANYLRTADVARLTLIATAVLLLCHLLSALSLSLPAFVAVRIVAGLSYGICYAVACYLASQSPVGVRIMSVAFMTASIVFAAAVFFLPPVVADLGLPGLFVPLAGLVLLTLLAVAKVGNLPRLHAASPVMPTAETTAGRRDLWLLLAACAFGSVGLQMLWTFSQGVAEARNFDINVTATILSVSMLFNLLGSAVAAALDQRAGISRPLVFGLLGSMSAAIVVEAWTSVPGFATGYLLYGFACFFVLPYLLSAGANLDESGRVVTLAGAVTYLGGAVSPLIGGLIADYLSLAAVNWAVAASCLIGALCAWALRGALDKEAGVPETNAVRAL